MKRKASRLAEVQVDDPTRRLPSPSLPVPEVIATDISTDLEAALEQFATIADDMKR